MAPPNPNPPATAPDDDDDEDDYMKMSFTEATTQPETSLQRRQRLQREGEQRSKIKSKAELAAQEASLREAALSRSLFDAPAPAAGKPKSKGLSMMAKMGFTGGSLGAAGNDAARAEPLRISIRDGREGIGVESERKRKLLEAAAAADSAAKKAKVDEGEYRERVRREREEARLDRQVHGAQKVAERMDDEGAEKKDGSVDGDTVEATNEGKNTKKTGTISSRPLKSIPVVYRGLVRGREEAERDRRMRHDLEQSLSRLPTYEDDEEDADDKKALGTSKTVYVTAEDLDEEDPELDEFNALDVAEKLRRLVEYLRKGHRYCFWCKFSYPDEAMEGCPGLTEEDHD